MSIAASLREAEIFDEMTATQLELVASVCEIKEYDNGDVIFLENSTGNELYVIAAGEIAIRVDPKLIGEERKEGPLTLTTLRRGQCFGEVALVDQGTRSASAHCVHANTRVVVIPRDKLMLLCDTYPQLGYRLMRNLAADLAMKIRNTDLLIRERVTWTP
jgi:CRP/FNR family cyclic AMP-dependent transcriptional regulator